MFDSIALFEKIYFLIRSNYVWMPFPGIRWIYLILNKNNEESRVPMRVYILVLKSYIHSC